MDSNVDNMYFGTKSLIKKWYNKYYDFIQHEYPDVSYEAKADMNSKYYRKLCKIGYDNLKTLNNKNYTDLSKFTSVV